MGAMGKNGSLGRGGSLVGNQFVFAVLSHGNRTARRLGMSCICRLLLCLPFRRCRLVVLEKGDGGFECLRAVRAAAEIIIDDCFFQLAVSHGVSLPYEQTCEVLPPRQLDGFLVERGLDVAGHGGIRRVSDASCLELAFENSRLLCRVITRLSSVRLDCIDSR